MFCSVATAANAEAGRTMRATIAIVNSAATATARRANTAVSSSLHGLYSDNDVARVLFAEAEAIVTANAASAGHPSAATN